MRKSIAIISVLCLLAASSEGRGQPRASEKAIREASGTDAIKRASEVAKSSAKKISKEMGWDAPGAPAIQIGESMPIARIRLQDLLKQPAPGSDPSRLAVDSGLNRIYPVMVAGKVETGLTLRFDDKSQDKWQMIGFGAQNHTQNLCALREADAKNNEVKTSAYRVINVPSLNREYLEVKKGDTVELIPTANDPEAGWEAGQRVPAQEALKKLKEIGEKHREEIERAPG